MHQILRRYSALLMAFALSIFSTWWLNLAAASAVPPHFQGDSLGYWQLATTLSRAGTFNSLTRTPLYPGFLAWIAQASLSAAIVTQTCLTLLIAFGAYQITRNGEGESSRAPALAALLIGASFNVNAAAGWILTETLFTFLLVVMVWAILRASQHKHLYRYMFGAGLLCGMLALCRPIALYLGIGLVGFLCTHSRLRRRPGAIGIFILCGALLPATWAWRNFTQTGNFTLSTIAAINLYEYRAAWIVAQTEHISPQVAQADLRARFKRELGDRTMTEAEQAQRYTRKALKILADAPLLTLRQGLEGLARIFLDFNNFESKLLCSYLASRAASTHTQRDQGLYAPCKAGLIIYQAVFLLVVYVGIGLIPMCWRTFGGDSRFLIALAAALIAYFALLSAGAEANVRFRMPFEPLLCVLSALGWSRWTKAPWVPGRLQNSGASS